MTLRDNANDMERRLTAVEDHVARSWITNPTVSTAGGGSDIILGQATGAVASGDATFSVDSVFVVSGEDPGAVVIVKNTFAMEIENNQLVRAEKNDDDEWETIRPGEGSDPLVVAQFELTSDLTLIGNDATANILNDDGSPSVNNVLVHDHNAWFSGLAAYDGADGNPKTGFKGTAVQFVGDVANWYIVGLEGLFPTIRITLTEDVEEKTGPIKAQYDRGYGSNFTNRTPHKYYAIALPEVSVEVYNTEHWADGSEIGDEWFCFYDPILDKYELSIPRPLTPVIPFIATETIPAAVMSQTTITNGVGSAIPTVRKPGPRHQTDSGWVTNPGGLPVLNMSVTPIVGSSTVPVALLCTEVYDGFLILNNMDFRGGPNFKENINQVWSHRNGDDDFRLSDFCFDERYVTAVRAKSDELVFDRIEREVDCRTEELSIISLGPCDEPAAASSQWEDTGFSY